MGVICGCMFVVAILIFNWVLYMRIPISFACLNFSVPNLLIRTSKNGCYILTL